MALTPQNWEAERDKLEGQHYISAKSQSATGGWIEYVEQFVMGGPEGVAREDSVAKWQRDPIRRVVFELNALKMSVGKQRAVALARTHGISSAEDLVARRDDPALGIPSTIKANLALAPVGASATRMDADETAAILGHFAAAARDLGLATTPVGSFRRGKIGGHDLDVMIHAPEDAPAVSVADYEFDVDGGAGYRLLDAFFAKLAGVTAFGEPFLHPHRVRGGAIGATTAPRLGVRHGFVRSPVVRGAFRQVDFVLCPSEILAHALLGWSGSTSFQRSLRDYVNHCHEKDWEDVPDGAPVVGRRGWNLHGGCRVEPPVLGRQLADDEHWAWSQNGIQIARGRHKSKDGDTFDATYEEDNASLRTESDVFAFFHLAYLDPTERCA